MIDLSSEIYAALEAVRPRAPWEVVATIVEPTGVVVHFARPWVAGCDSPQMRGKRRHLECRIDLDLAHIASLVKLGGRARAVVTRYLDDEYRRLTN